MKVLFVISSNGAGKGGHYNSLDHISRAIATVAEVKIVSIGLTESPLLKENPYYYGSFYFKWYSFLALNKPFKALFKTFNPDVVHCFDGGAALMLMTLPVMWNKTLIHTKCGGPNERYVFAQLVGTVILFSQENLNSFKSNKRFKDSDIYLIPNRIFNLELLPENQRILRKDEHVFTFLRISRIGRNYKHSINQSIELMRLFQPSLKVKLLVIGVVEDNAILQEFVKYIGEQRLLVEFITNDEYTTKASRMLYLADAVIGTGRGAMEAMVLGLPVLLPVKDGSIPVLLNENTFDDLLQTNFSERGTTKNVTHMNNVESIQRLVSEHDFYEIMSAFSKEKGNTHFALTKSDISKYSDLYKRAIAKPNRFYLLKNLIPLIYYINVYRRVMKREA